MGASYDVIVLGLGAMGSSAVYHLARRPARVLGMDRFHPPHDRGSSHGQTRVIREAYFEDPRYVPLIQRAYDLWQELEQSAGRRLSHLPGGVMMGPPDGALLAGAKASADQHGLAYEELTSAQIHGRFPGLDPGPDMAGLWEPRAGILLPEACVEAHLSLAATQGAELHFEETVRQWAPHGSGVRVQTDRGEYEAQRLILSAGSWLPFLWPECPMPMRVERQVMFWFEPDSKPLFQLDRLPVFVWEYEPGQIFYGLPDLGHGLKVARPDVGEATHPDRVKREVAKEEAQPVLELASRLMPKLGRNIVSQTTCLYTRTPDSHFLLDRHPDHSQIIVASPCSGHGFKFSSVVGEILADMALDRPISFDLGLFGWRDGRIDAA